MSENSIDVDVNFNLKEIDKIFEKLMEGTSTNIFKDLSDVTDLDEEGLASLLKDITSLDDKTKLLEAFNKLNMKSPIMENLIRMVTDLSEDSEHDTELIERTQSNLITMLSISKLMLKMIDEKFPISEEIQDEIEKMSKAITDEEMKLDDRLDLISRTMNSILATSSGQNVAFRIVTPEVSIAERLPDERLQGIRDEFGAVIGIIEDLTGQIVSADEESGRLRTPQLNVDNAVSALDRAKELFEEVNNALRESVDNMSTQETLTEGQETRGRMDIEHRITQMTQISALVGLMKESLDKFVLEAKDTIAIAMQNMDVATESIIKLAIDLDPSKVGVTADQIAKLKEAMKKGLKNIEDKITEELHVDTVEQIFEQAIEKRLMTDPLDEDPRRKIGYIIDLINATFNRLITDFRTVIKTPEQRELLKEAGLAQIISIPHILDSAERRMEDIGGVGSILNREMGTSFDTKHLEVMIGQIQSTEQQTKVHMGKLSEDMKIMLEVVNRTEGVAIETGKEAKFMSDNFGQIKGAVLSASQQILSAKKSISETNVKVNEVVQRFTEENPGKDIQPLDDPSD